MAEPIPANVKDAADRADRPKVVVVSPHLDDAVMSVGATMHALSQRNVDVQLVTMFAGDPGRRTRASHWDDRRGFDAAASATGERRDEDLRASEILGVTPTWLPFDDGSYLARRDPDEVWAALAPLLVTAAAVLVPGWPLSHGDHRFTTMLLFERLRSTAPLMCYVELPYGVQPMAIVKAALRRRRSAMMRHLAGDDLLWSTTTTSKENRNAKGKAVQCYRKELDALGREGTFAALHDRLVGREVIGHRPDEALPPGLFPGVT